VEWEVLSDDTGDGRPLHDGPHVVHLSGAPLLTLPGTRSVPGTRWDDPRSAEELKPVLKGIWAGLQHVGVLRFDLDGARHADSVRHIVIEHAVTTDEYLAVRQAEAELLLTSTREKDRSNRRSRALPPFLTSSNVHGDYGKGQNPRFWMLVGVPMGDPAIRHRVISQLSPRRPDPDPIRLRPEDDGDLVDVGVLTTSAVVELDEDDDLDALLGLGGDEDEMPVFEHDGRAPTGIVVNRRITDDQSHLLYWMGFDIVRDSAASFSADLRHYRSHLRGSGWHSWPATHLRCDLMTTMIGDR
jgi:hypothetical protein